MLFNQKINAKGISFLLSEEERRPEIRIEAVAAVNGERWGWELDSMVVDERSEELKLVFFFSFFFFTQNDVVLGQRLLKIKGSPGSAYLPRPHRPA